MKKRILGKTGLKVAEIGVGCWAIGGPFINLGVSAGWGNVSKNKAKDGLLFALKKGANLFDTADVYGLGQSERLLGAAIKESKKVRSEVVIVGKTGYFKGCASHGFDPLQMRHQLEMSLQNLQTDYIDIYFFHHLDFGENNYYLDKAIEIMHQFKKQGYIRFIGLRGPHSFSLFRGRKSGFSGTYQGFLDLADKIKPDVISVRYNMITPTYEKEDSNIFKWAKKKNIGVITYKPLGQGLLLDKYDPNSPPIFGPGDHRMRKVWFQKKGLSVIKKKLALIKKYFNISDKKQLVQLCINYVLSRNDSLCVIVGFKNKRQLAESLKTKGKLRDEDIKYIQTIFKDIKNEIGGFTDFSKDSIL